MKAVDNFALDTIGSVFAQAKFVSRFSLSECNASARLRENGENGSLAYGNKNGEGADGRLEIARVGMEHGTNAEDGESKDTEIATVALRQERTQHGSLAYANMNGERGDGIEHGPKAQDGKSEGTHGWKCRSSRRRCLF